MADAGAVHVPVLLREVVAALRPERGGVYVDATLGLGGQAAVVRVADRDQHVAHKTVAADALDRRFCK